MEIKNIATIECIDKYANQKALAIVRRHGNNASLCLSLESDGDVEMLISQEDIKNIITALRESIENTDLTNAEQM